MSLRSVTLKIVPLDFLLFGGAESHSQQSQWQALDCCSELLLSQQDSTADKYDRC